MAAHTSPCCHSSGRGDASQQLSEWVWHQQQQQLSIDTRPFVEDLLTHCVCAAAHCICTRCALQIQQTPRPRRPCSALGRWTPPPRVSAGQAKPLRCVCVALYFSWRGSGSKGWECVGQHTAAGRGGQLMKACGQQLKPSHGSVLGLRA